MPLPSGTRVGSYEILAPLGAGGMGEVYRARDPRLGRDVAIKALPEELSRSPDKVARFEREARLLAALSHPRIATLHAVEEGPVPAAGEKGALFLVMELVEGETLAERLARGPIPAEEALPLALQIAEALEAAHEKGVVHRDLKPGNVKVDAEGDVKVLDFGLAKAFAADEDEAEGEFSQSPTLSREMTQAGVILGTAAYMSPEQAKGRTVDRRSDVFSFGAVLYEMLCGRKAFAGEDVSDTLAAILRSEPDWSALPPGLDPRVDRLVRRCLRKDRKARLQAVGDARVEIQEVLAEPRSADAAETRPAASPAWRLALAAAVAGAIAGGVAVWSLTRLPSDPPAPDRFVVTPPAADQLGISGVAISPDGRSLVYVATRDGVRQLHHRSLDRLDATPIPGTEDAEYPFFAPDGERIGFFAGNALKTVRVDGGFPITLCPAGSRRGASWGTDDFIVFASDDSLGLMRVAAAGGEPEAVFTPEPGTGQLRWPEVLPGGRLVLSTRYRAGLDDIGVSLISLDTAEERTLLGGAHPRYSPTGHIVFGRANSLWAVPFDLERHEMTGAPAPVQGDVQVNSGGLANFALAANGTLFYIGLGSQSERRFVWVDRSGREEPLAAAAGPYDNFDLSPRGGRIAAYVGGDNPGVWTYDILRDIWSRLPQGPQTAWNLIWTRSGDRVVFPEPDGLSWMDADGTGSVEQLVSSPRFAAPMTLARDGTTLLYAERDGDSTIVSAVPLEGERTPQMLGRIESLGGSPTEAVLSPDGRWLAYRAAESGRDEVYVRAFPELTGRQQVSNDGGAWPLWAPDGTELYYLGPLGMMAVPVEADTDLALGPRERLFDTSPYVVPPTYNVPRIGMGPDGRFLMLRFGDGTQTTTTGQQLVLVQNWAGELTRLAPPTAP